MSLFIYVEVTLIHTIRPRPIDVFKTSSHFTLILSKLACFFNQNKTFCLKTFGPCECQLSNVNKINYFIIRQRSKFQMCLPVFKLQNQVISYTVLSRSVLHPHDDSTVK